MESEREKRKIRILAFGDSLTAGLTGYQCYPYITTLKEDLEQNFPDILFQMFEVGWCGERVEKMITRLQSDVLSSNNNEHFDYILILGGTNNLSSSTAEFIYSSLETLHNLVLNNNNVTKTVAITIPEMSYPRGVMFEEDKRKEINDRLKEFAEKNERVLFFDLGKEILNGYKAKTPEREKYSEYWSDNIHFSKSGYQLFGHLLFKALQPHFLLSFSSTV